MATSNTSISGINNIEYFEDKYIKEFNNQT